MGPVHDGGRVAASAFAFMNLVARPAGGMLSDLSAAGSARSPCCWAAAAGFVLMATMGRPGRCARGLGVHDVLVLRAGRNGAVYAVVPLVKKRVTGQIVGSAGAYGNVGGSSS